MGLSPRHSPVLSLPCPPVVTRPSPHPPLFREACPGSGKRVRPLGHARRVPSTFPSGSSHDQAPLLTHLSRPSQVRTPGLRGPAGAQRGPGVRPSGREARPAGRGAERGLPSAPPRGDRPGARSPLSASPSAAPAPPGLRGAGASSGARGPSPGWRVTWAHEQGPLVSQQGRTAPEHQQSRSCRCWSSRGFPSTGHTPWPGSRSSRDAWHLGDLLCPVWLAQSLSHCHLDRRPVFLSQACAAGGGALARWLVVLQDRARVWLCPDPAGTGDLGPVRLWGLLGRRSWSSRARGPPCPCGARPGDSALRLQAISINHSSVLEA